MSRMKLLAAGLLVLAVASTSAAAQVAARSYSPETGNTATIYREPSGRVTMEVIDRFGRVIFRRSHQESVAPAPAFAPSNGYGATQGWYDGYSRGYGDGYSRGYCDGTGNGYPRPYGSYYDPWSRPPYPPYSGQRPPW